jgi:predicted CXXCH cytochrome family protein
VVCHRPADIGVRDSRGMLLAGDARRVPFHQALVEGDCTACHSEHGRAGSREKQVMPFEHSLLKANLRGTCQGCHKAPVDDLHAGGILPCAQCHQTSTWKPATFDHGEYFPLTGEHNAPCGSCHQGPGFKSYTCYGCHEHERSRMIAEHLEEGIRNIDGCVRCHNGAGLKGHDGRDGRDEGDD